MRQSWLRRISLQGLALVAFVGLVNGHNGMSMSHQHSLAAVETRKADDPWSHDQLIEPSGLATLLSSQNRPVVLQVGIIHLFRTSHVPGAKFAGPADSAEGLDLLKKQAGDLDRNTQIVCYCGCCPWDACPNTRPAYKLLSGMGFKKIKVLYLPKNFNLDWVAKGFAIEKGGA